MTINNFKRVPKTGVLFVMAKAEEQGFYYGNREWTNLGQGAPETGDILSGLSRSINISIDHVSAEYGPVAGSLELRKAIATLYNHRYRRDKKSQYTHANVAISSGGRSALTRIAATIDNVNLGHFLPDYTAYEELLGLFNSFVAIPIPANEKNGFKLSLAEIKAAIIDMGLGAILLSNPCNPTGQVLQGGNLHKLIKTTRELGCSVIFDEFYAHYVYRKYKAESLSAARYVEDVDRDGVLIVDGLTKNWRYPGLRIGWTLGPAELIDSIAAAGSFLDGGATHAIQSAVLPLLTPKYAGQECRSIQNAFRCKRDYMFTRLSQMGFVFKSMPTGGFYCFPSLENIAEPLQDGMVLFNKLLKRKVICVPGEFFDVNPGRRRRNIKSRLKKYVRFSFGPNMDEITQGLDRIEALLKDFS